LKPGIATKLTFFFNRIYLIRYDGMGDVLWTEPLLEHLAQSGKTIIVVSHHNELFQNYPYQNVYFRRRLKKREKIWMFLESLFFGQSHFINLNDAYEKSPKQHFLQAYLQKANVTMPLRYPQLFLSDKEKLQPLVRGKYVILHLESSNPKNYRRVYGIDWPTITENIHALGFEIIQIGKDTQPIPATRQIKTHSLRELINLIYHSHFFIGLDSGPSHIAACLQKPGLIFFGAVNPLFRHLPEFFKGLFLQQPCEYAGCYHEVIGTGQQTCRLVGNNGIPKCCLHTNDDVLNNVNMLIRQYNL
jgi:ADP-heptose:LPS heptosyltransferase